MKKNSVTEKLLREITARIVECFHPEKVILFGSYAYGSPTVDSDLDLFILMKTKKRPFERKIAVSRIFVPRPLAMDFIVLTPSEVRRRLKGFDPFLEDVLFKARVLYAK